MSEIAKATGTADLVALAAKINEEHRACDRAMREGLGHAVRAGELLLEAKGRVRHGEWGAWVGANFEGSERTAQAYMKVAREVPQLEGAEAQRVADLSYRDALRELAAPAGGGGEKVHFSSKNDEWYTPPHIIERVAAALGGIDLDPCADPRRSVPALEHFTKDDCGLSREWRGRLFMNPPYSEARAWMEKLGREWRAGRVAAAIALVPARTDTGWFWLLGETPMCFVRGRLKFSGHENSAPFPSALLYLGADKRGFSRGFSGLGVVVEPVDTPFEWTGAA